MNQGIKIIVTLGAILLFFGGIVFLAYREQSFTTSLEEYSLFVEIPTVTVPVFSHDSDLSGNLTVGMQILVEEGGDINPNYFIGSIDNTLRELNFDNIMNIGSVEYIQTSVRDSLNHQTSFNVTEVYVTEIFSTIISSNY